MAVCSINDITIALSLSSCGLSLNGSCRFHEWPDGKHFSWAEMSPVARQANAGKLGGRKPGLESPLGRPVRIAPFDKAHLRVSVSPYFGPFLRCSEVLAKRNRFRPTSRAFK